MNRQIVSPIPEGCTGHMYRMLCKHPFFVLPSPVSPKGGGAPLRATARFTPHIPSSSLFRDAIHPIGEKKKKKEKEERKKEKLCLSSWRI